MKALNTKTVAAAVAVVAVTVATVAMACPASKDGMDKADENAAATTHEPSVNIAQMVKAKPTQAKTTQAKQQSHWVDVRTPQEYAGGHVDAASNIPHTEIAQRIAEITTDKNAEINLYCRSGRRSGIATSILKQMGYTNVHNRGGYQQLVSQAQ